MGFPSPFVTNVSPVAEPQLLVTVTEYKPGLFTTYWLPVDPSCHRYDKNKPGESTNVSPSQSPAPGFKAGFGFSSTIRFTVRMLSHPFAVI